MCLVGLYLRYAWFDSVSCVLVGVYVRWVSLESNAGVLGLVTSQVCLEESSCMLNIGACLRFLAEYISDVLGESLFQVIHLIQCHAYVVRFCLTCAR